MDKLTTPKNSTEIECNCETLKKYIDNYERKMYLLRIMIMRIDLIDELKSLIKEDETNEENKNYNIKINEQIQKLIKEIDELRPQIYLN